jgi:hypothetical protein
VGDEVEVKTRWSGAKDNRIARRFLKKTPLDPLQRAARLPGRALHVYLAIRHRCDLRREQTVTLPAAYLQAFGIIGKDVKRRALAELETAGLIRVERLVGRTARVTLME